MTTVQTYLPRAAFDALDMPTIVAVARMAGIPNPRIESSMAKIPNTVAANSTRVTCQLDMALALVEAFKQQAAKAQERHDTDLLIATAGAVKALLDAIGEAAKPAPPIGPIRY